MYPKEFVAVDGCDCPCQLLQPSEVHIREKISFITPQGCQYTRLFCILFPHFLFPWSNVSLFSFPFATCHRPITIFRLTPATSNLKFDSNAALGVNLGVDKFLHVWKLIGVFFFPARRVLVSILQEIKNFWTKVAILVRCYPYTSC